MKRFYFLYVISFTCYIIYFLVSMLFLCTGCDNNRIYKETVVKAFETNSNSETRTDLNIKFIEFKTKEITVLDSIKILEEQINQIQKEIDALHEQKENFFLKDFTKKNLNEKLQNSTDKLKAYKAENNKGVIGIKVNCSFSFQDPKSSAKKEAQRELILSPDGKRIYYIKPTKGEQGFYDMIEEILNF